MSASTVLTRGLLGTPSELLTFGFGIGSMSTAAQIAQAVWNYTIEGAFTTGDLLRIIAAVSAGKTITVSPTAGSAHVIFRTVTDSGDIVAGDTVASDRTSVVLTP